MPVTESLTFRLVIALCIGLLIGLERERRKGHGPTRGAAGIRTFTLTALLGAVAVQLGGVMLLAAIGLGLALLLVVAYWRSPSKDPGLTTEASQLLTLLLGALALKDPALASGLAVTVAVLLVARAHLHYFVKVMVNEQELLDALIFATSALVILPLLPARYLGPFHAFNPHTIWTFVVLMMGIGFFGHIALRGLGPHFGLPVSGLFSGFVSSTATISAMGMQAARTPELCRPAVTGAVFSSIATFIQLAAVLWAISLPTLYAMALPLLFGTVAATLYGVFFAFRLQNPPEATQHDPGRAFDLRLALLLAALISVILFLSAVVHAWLGKAGVIFATALSGFADAQSPAASVASLVAAGKMTPVESVLPILAGVSTNTLSKAVMAFSSGSRSFALQVVLGLVFMIVATWLGFALSL